METNNLRIIQCSLCGCSELINQGNNTYYCKNCKTIYENNDYEKMIKDFNTSIVDTVVDVVKQELDKDKAKQIGNARLNLYKELKEPYLSSKKIIECAKTLKDFLPDDVFANFFYNIENSTKLSKYMEKMQYLKLQTPQKNTIVEFLLRSVDLLKKNVPTELNELISTYDKKSEEWQKYYTEYKGVMEKVDTGFFDVNIHRDVFVAYSSKDKDQVKEIVEILENNDLSCFVAFRNLFHGSGAQENYQEYLRKAMDNCSIFLFVSSTSSRTRNCEALTIEMEYIKSRDKNNLPPEMRNLPYSSIDLCYKKPRVEYIIEDYNGVNIAGENSCNEFFAKIERVFNKEQLVIRVDKILKDILNNGLSNQYNNAGIETKENSNVKICLDCNSKNDINAKFCGVCGSSKLKLYTDYIKEKEIKICSKCGAEVPKGNKFCTSCGSIDFFNTKEEYLAYNEQQREQEQISIFKKKYKSIDDITIGTIITFGRYQGEPIEWEIKDKIDNKFLVVTKNIIECKMFDKNTNIWRDSEIRKWLNGDFYNNSFTDKEKVRISQYTHTDTLTKTITKIEGRIFKKKVVTEIPNSITTIDNIFLLSKEDVEKYYREYDDRKKQGTQNAKNNGLYVSNYNDKTNGNSFWCLRSPSNEEDVYSVDTSGIIYNFFSPSNNDAGIVCAMLLDLK